jgi:hypothetical protein
MPVGRPSSYTDETANLICYQISRGESLGRICAAKELPTKETVLSWLVHRPDFYANYARARLAQAEVMDERILEVAARCEAGEIDPHAAKVVISAYQWRAARLSPRVYGDATMLKHADADGNVLKIELSRVEPRPAKVIDVTPEPAALPPAPEPEDTPG